MNEQTLNNQKNKMDIISLVLGLPVTFVTNLISLIFFVQSVSSDRFPSESKLEDLLSSSHTGVAFAVIGMIAGAIAIVAGIFAIKKQDAKKGKALVGLIFGVISVVIAVILLLINIIQGSSISDVLDRFY